MNKEKSIQNGFSEKACDCCKLGLPVNWREEVASSSLDCLQEINDNETSRIAPEYKKEKGKRSKTKLEFSPVTVIPLISQSQSSQSQTQMQYLLRRLLTLLPMKVLMLVINI